MTVIGDIIKFLVKMGLLDVILPFVLTFSVSYGVLKKNRTISSNNNLNAIISLVLGLLVVGAINIMEILNTAIFYFVLGIIGFLMFFIIASFVSDWKPNKFPLILGFLFLIIVSIILFIEEINIEIVKAILEPLIPILIFLAVIVVIIWFILSKPEKKSVEEVKKTTEIKEKPDEDKELKELEKIKKMIPHRERKRLIKAQEKELEKAKKEIEEGEEKLKKIKKMFRG